MPRSSDNKTPKKNRTEERLRATPFKKVDILDDEENSIRHSVWRRFTESKIIDELSTKPEFVHVSKELEAGLSCSLNGGSPKDRIYKISSAGQGLMLEVNRKFAESLGEHQLRFFQGVVQAGIEGYGALYMQIKGLLPRPNIEAVELEALAQTKKDR